MRYQMTLRDIDTNEIIKIRFVKHVIKIAQLFKNNEIIITYQDQSEEIIKYPCGTFYTIRKNGKDY